VIKIAVQYTENAMLHKCLCGRSGDDLFVDYDRRILDLFVPVLEKRKLSHQDHVFPSFLLDERPLKPS
jgi:hypothetical protein